VQSSGRRTKAGSCSRGAGAEMPISRVCIISKQPTTGRGIDEDERACACPCHRHHTASTRILSHTIRRQSPHLYRSHHRRKKCAGSSAVLLSTTTPPACRAFRRCSIPIPTPTRRRKTKLPTNKATATTLPPTSASPPSHQSPTCSRPSSTTSSFHTTPRRRIARVRHRRKTPFRH
jgi:hypothetical protein